MQRFRLIRDPSGLVTAKESIITVVGFQDFVDHVQLPVKPTGDRQSTDRSADSQLTVSRLSTDRGLKYS